MAITAAPSTMSASWSALVGSSTVDRYGLSLPGERRSCSDVDRPP